MVTINPKKRHDEILARREARADDVSDEDMYHCVEVLSWNKLKDELNYWGSKGWRVVTIRDGLRGNGMDLGYRIVLERVK